MSTVTVGPRVEFDTDGYVRIRVWDAQQQAERYLYLHRLVAFAQGELSDLHGSEHVHHDNADPWDNRPANLEALTPEQHCEIDPQVGNFVSGD